MQPQIEKFRMTKIVTIKQNEHANLDSFTLRYGFQFDSNTELEIQYDPSTVCPDKNPKYSDRYNVIAKFTNPDNNRTERGVFILINNQNNKFYDNDKVVTVIRYLDEAETEHHLSEVIKSLRISKVLTPHDLINLHPFYMTRQLSTHADLIKILGEKKSSEEIIKIQSIALDEYFKNQNNIDFIKIDIAGAESLVLDCMDSILKNNNVKIIQEWWPNAIRKHGREPDKHLNYLSKLGYKIYEIDGAKDEVNQITIPELMKKYPNSKMEDINLFCKK